jgi:hypothetical protein
MKKDRKLIFYWLAAAFVLPAAQTTRDANACVADDPEKGIFYRCGAQTDNTCEPVVKAAKLALRRGRIAATVHLGSDSKSTPEEAIAQSLDTVAKNHPESTDSSRRVLATHLQPLLALRKKCVISDRAVFGQSIYSFEHGIKGDSSNPYVKVWIDEKSHLPVGVAGDDRPTVSFSISPRKKGVQKASLMTPVTDETLTTGSDTTLVALGLLGALHR